MNPRPPDKPILDEKVSRGTSATKYLALGFCLLLVATLLLLPTGFIGLSVVLGGGLFLGVIAFHYFVWGWWLNRMLREEALREQEAEQSDR